MQKVSENVLLLGNIKSMKSNQTSDLNPKNTYYSAVETPLNRISRPRMKERTLGSKVNYKSERLSSFMKKKKSISHKHEIMSKKRRNLDKYLVDQRSSSNQHRLHKRQKVTLEQTAGDSSSFETRSRSMKRGMRLNNLNDVYKRKKHDTSLSKRQEVSRKDSKTKLHSKSVLSNNKRLKSPGQNIRVKTGQGSRRMLQHNFTKSSNKDNSIQEEFYPQ